MLVSPSGTQAMVHLRDGERMDRLSRLALPGLLTAAAIATSCGGDQASTPPSVAADQITLTLAVTSLIVPPDGTAVSVGATVTHSGSTEPVTLTVSGLPSGVDVTINSPGLASSGGLTFTAQTTAPPGTYALTVTASDGTVSSTASLSLVVAVVAKIGAGVQGRLATFMSTSFQPADWDYQFFALNPNATATLARLRPQHIRLQAIDGGVPQKDARTWDFTELDAVVNPVLSVGDHSPEFQIAVAPGFMNDANGHLLRSHFQDFANYCANLVKYYNTTSGFTDAAGVTHAHQPFQPITWWGIFNEPNINGLTASDYTALYNLVVPAMQSAGSSVPLKFVALELADFGNEPEKFLPTFVSDVTAEVDAVATHYYSSCNQSDPDTALLTQVTQTFVPHVQYIRSQLRTRPSLASVPVWVTENNVNADFEGPNGMSACNPGQKFVIDPRGTSPFFAGWRPYVFSQLAQAGAAALYHWDFDADRQYGEVDYDTGKPYLSYWVDRALQSFFPSPPGADIVQSVTSAANDVETLAVRNADGSVVIMIADHAVQAPTDNNGPGAPRTIIVNTSALGSFSSVNQLTLDSNTDPANGPVSTSIPPAPRITLTLKGYGVTFLVLKP